MHSLNSIHWKKILEIDEFIFKSKSKKIKLDRIKIAFSDLFFKIPNLEKDKTIDTNILFLKTMKRNDYDRLFNEIVSTCPESSREIIDIEYKDSNYIRLYPLKVFFKFFFLYKKAFRSSFLDSIFLIIRMMNYLEIYDKTRYYSYKNLVVFADMQPVDNLLVQMANIKNITTVTMQHGLYIDYKDYVTENAVNYLHCVSNVFLAWGDDTRNLIKKYHPKTRIEIVGKPVKQQKKKEQKKYFTVVFDANYFMGHNFELLEIAYEICKTLDLKVNLKLHPRNCLEWFNIKKDITHIDEDILASKFILGHTTTMLYDCMIFGIPSFRYKTNKPSNIISSKLEFNNGEELLNILNNLETTSLDYNKVSENYFKYISKESKKQYTSFFNKLLDKEL